MPRSTLVVAMLLMSLCPIARTADPDEVASYQQAVDRIVAASLREGRAYDMLVELCEAAPRRLAGSPGAAAAVEWARHTMQELELEDIRLQEVTVPRWIRGDVEVLKYAEPSERAGDPIPMLALGGSVATPPGGLTAEVVVVDGLDEVAALGEKARGKIVLLNGRMDPGLANPFSAYSQAVPQRSRGAVEAAKVGAVGALVRSMTNVMDDTPHTGATRYADGVPRIPFGAISTNAAAEIAALVESGRRVVVHFELNSRTLPDTQGYNVIGELKGRSSPEEILVVGGHLDAWDVGVGAHDDGGGCCQALEAVRLLKSLDLIPRRTIRVVLFANEENGLAGGKGYMEGHRDQMDRHVLALESDSGVFTPRGFRTNANPEAFAILESISSLLEGAGASQLTQGGGGADIGPLRSHGVVQVGFQPDPQRYFELHHTHEDTLDKVSTREINLGAGVMAALLYVVADLEVTLPRNPGT